MADLALYHPEIPQNTGTLMRLAACLNLPIHIIEPCGFVWNDQKLKRAGMDYLDKIILNRHEEWASFTQWAQQQGRRIVLIDTQGKESFLEFKFYTSDILLLGQESCGVPPEVFSQTSTSIYIPMVAGVRSLNIAVAGAMVVTECLRQIKGFPS